MGVKLQYIYMIILRVIIRRLYALSLNDIKSLEIDLCVIQVWVNIKKDNKNQELNNYL